jgi:hypothetical protein
MALPIKDRGRRGLEFPKPTILLGGVDPTRSIYAFEDFIGDHIAEDSTIVVSQSGIPTTAAALNAGAGFPVEGHGGWIAGSVDNVDDEIDEVALGAKPWLNPAALNARQLVVAEIALVVPSALTARGYFAGLGDAETGGADDDGMLSISTGTTLVSGATGDAAGFVMSSLATDNDAWYSGAVKATVVGTALNLATASEGPVNIGPAVVDDYTKLRVEVDVLGNVWFYGIVSAAGQREVVPTFGDFQAAAITADIPYLPIFQARSTTTTAVEWELDYLFGAVVGS